MVTQALERKYKLGISPHMDFRTMRATVHEYYSKSFRGATGMLQLVMAEFRLSRHQSELARSPKELDINRIYRVAASVTVKSSQNFKSRASAVVITPAAKQSEDIRIFIG